MGIDLDEGSLLRCIGLNEGLLVSIPSSVHFWPTEQRYICNKRLFFLVNWIERVSISVSWIKSMVCFLAKVYSVHHPIHPTIFLLLYSFYSISLLFYISRLINWSSMLIKCVQWVCFLPYLYFLCVILLLLFPIFLQPCNPHPIRMVRRSQLNPSEHADWPIASSCLYHFSARIFSLIL